MQDSAARSSAPAAPPACGRRSRSAASPCMPARHSAYALPGTPIPVAMSPSRAAQAAAASYALDASPALPSASWDMPAYSSAAGHGSPDRQAAAHRSAASSYLPVS